MVSWNNHFKNSFSFFQAPPASQYLTQILNKMIMTPDVAFKLGPRVFHFLLDTFLYHDFSILNFVLGFQFSMIEHFLSNPLSALCSSPQEVSDLGSRLTKTHLAQIRKSSSFIRWAGFYKFFCKIREKEFNPKIFCLKIFETRVKLTF